MTVSGEPLCIVKIVDSCQLRETARSAPEPIEGLSARIELLRIRFGQVTSALDPRIMQFALKYVF